MFRTANPTAVGKHDDIPTYQHTNMQTYQHTSIPACKHANMQTCKPITMVIYIAGSISLFRGKRSNHFRLQRQSKHGALCRLKGQAAAPFPDKSSSRFAASVFIGKTLYPTAPCKRAFENGNDRPATHHRPKGKNNKVGLYGEAGGRDSHRRKADGQTDGTPQGIYEENTVAY